MKHGPVGAREALGCAGLCPSAVGLTVSLRAGPGAWASVLRQGRASGSFAASEVQRVLQQSCSWSWALSWTGEGSGHSGPLTSSLSGSPSPTPAAGDRLVCGLPDASVLASCLASLRGPASPTAGAWVLRPPRPALLLCGPGTLGVMPAPLQSVLPGLGVPVPRAVQGGLASQLCLPCPWLEG